MTSPTIDTTKEGYNPFRFEKVVAEGLSYAEFQQQFDGKHAEWWDEKVILVMSNNLTHQLIQDFFIALFNLYFGFTPVGRYVSAGYPMRPGNNFPTREPDLLIVLNENRERMEATYLDGIPDIAIEIVSPESIGRDYGEKFTEYERARIPEYWIIDTVRQRVEINVLSELGSYQLFNQPDGPITSKILPNFQLEQALLWDTDNLPAGQALVDLVTKMAKT